jgi:putative addiction module killer protein
VIELRETAVFSKWLDRLRDRSARNRIQVRLTRLQLGLAGDVQPVGEGVSELRINYGPGYRVYFKRCGAALIFLLGGGDKSTQERDIQRAKELARNL